MTHYEVLNRITERIRVRRNGIYGICHQVSPKHLQRYCDEFASRYNSREIKDHERFIVSLRSSEGPLTYNQLTGK